ncbi:MAG: nucleotide exchange factor GrpE [Bacteroidia bacterium]
MSKESENPELKEELNPEAVDANAEGFAVESSSEEVADLSLEDQVQAEREKYLRLYSEFENFRRRTTKDRLEWMQNASRDVILAFLPVLDDMERAIKAAETASSDEAKVMEGLQLIHQKFWKIMEKNGVKAIQSQGEAFDTDLHEAVTQFPAPSEDLKGKVIDELEKGYTLNDKVIRFAKVVVGQ